MATFPRNVVFLISDDGDPETGIGGSESEVRTFIQDETHLAVVRAALSTLFCTLHDARVRVLTEEELAVLTRLETE